MDEQEVMEQNNQQEQAEQEQLEQVEQMEQMQPVPEEDEDQQEPGGEEQEQGEDQQAQGGEEEQEDEEQEEQGENPQEAGQQVEGEAPQNADQQGDGGELAGDDINQEIAEVAAEAGLDNQEPQEEADPDRAFDTLDDLKRLDGDNGNAGQENDNQEVNENLKKTRQAVMQARKGNLYKAVICARMLENGENPAAEQQQNAGAAPGRFTRFMNSSKLDTAGKVLKQANAASGLLGMASPKYKQSKIGGLISTANDVIVLVNSIRGIMKKLKTYKATATSVRKKVFAVIGLVTDFSMAVAKGASLTKLVLTKLGYGGGILAKVMGYLSSFSLMASQLSALTGAANSLAELATVTHKLKKAQKAEEDEVVKILAAHEIQSGAEGGAEQENAQEKPKKRRRLRKKRVQKEQVINALQRPDLTEEEKTVLASYLGRGRNIAKKELALANVSTSLITVTLGLGTSISKSVMNNTTGDDKLRAAKSTTILGGLANADMLLTAAGMHIAGKKVNKGPEEEESNLIKEGLWGALHNLASDDKYGLRKVAATIAPDNATEEQVTEAGAVVAKYGTAEKQLAGSGVDFAKLFQAKDIDTFKNTLVAGL